MNERAAGLPSCNPADEGGKLRRLNLRDAFLRCEFLPVANRQQVGVGTLAHFSRGLRMKGWKQNCEN
jgi:hypothetical protein